MNITREQYEADIRKAKADVLREFAFNADIPDDDIDFMQGMAREVERRNVCDEAHAMADELERA